MSGFVKLDTEIFGSSIMDEDPLTRLVWVFLLAAADRRGIVDATPRALARQFNLELPVVLAAIKTLEAPDPESRTPRAEGRRITRLDDHREWGWRIVNYQLYRQARDDEERREYKRQWMANDRAAKAGRPAPYPSLVDSPQSPRLSTVDGVDECGPMQRQRQMQKAEEEKKKKRPPAVSLPEPYGMYSKIAEARLLAELIKNGNLEPEISEAKMNNRPALEIERARRLAKLWLADQNGANGRMTLAEKWSAWRVERKLQNRGAKPVEKDVVPEITALRELSGRKAKQISAFLDILVKRGWLTVDPKQLEPKPDGKSW